MKVLGRKMEAVRYMEWRDRTGRISASAPRSHDDEWAVSIEYTPDAWANGYGRTLETAEKRCVADLRRIHREAGEWLERAEKGLARD